MPLKARVGRHTHDKGRQCQNFVADQNTVIELLFRIPVADGGVRRLVGSIVPGLCNDDLYHAILQFEDRYFPGKGSGFVEPNGALLKRMEDLAARAQAKAAAPKAVAETTLDVLRRNVQKVDVLAGKWTAGDCVQMDRLVAMAVKHIDDLKNVKDKSGSPLGQLPSWGELFGKVFVAKHGEEVTVPKSGLLATDRRGNSRKVEDTMRYGAPITWHDDIVTWKLPALILFQDGLCYFAPSRSRTDAAEAHEDAKHGAPFRSWL